MSKMVFDSQNRLCAELFHNCIHVEKDREGYIARRFLPEQSDCLEHIQDNAASTGTNKKEFGLISRTSAGCVLDFFTSTKHMEIGFSVLDAFEEKADRKPVFDIYVNSLLLKSIAFSKCFAGEQSFFLDFAKGFKRVTIWLPQYAETCIRYLLTEPDNAVIPTHDRHKTCLLIGDSITQGAGSVHASGGFAMCCARQSPLTELMNWINQGISGWMYSMPFPWKKTDIDVGQIILALGTNDWAAGYSLDEILYHTEQYVDTACKFFPNASLLVITPFHRLDEFCHPKAKFPLNKFYEEAMAAFSKKKNLRILDGMTLSSKGKNSTLDGVHPNDCGHTFIANSLIKEGILMKQHYSQTNQRG